MKRDDCTAVQIIRLDHQQNRTATDIHAIMQAAYKIEAELLGVEDFHPLKRGITNIQTATTVFYGFQRNDSLAAVIEIEQLPDSTIEIDSLVVTPAFFRQGLGSRILKHVFTLFPGRAFLVSTGAKNLPALNLYRKLGFIDSKLWETPCGIKMISLARPVTNS